METNITLERKETKSPFLFGIITSPTAQFERLKEKNQFGLSFVIMLLLMAITGALASQVSLNNPILKNANTEFHVPAGLTMGLGAGGALIGGAIMLILVATLYKVCMILMGNDTSYKKLLAIVIYSSFISSLGTLVNNMIALSLGGYEPTYTSLAPLLANNDMLHTIAKNFDIFQIWYYFVLVIGLNIVAGLSKNKAITLVVVIFLIGIGLSSLSGLIF